MKFPFQTSLATALLTLIAGCGADNTVDRTSAKPGAEAKAAPKHAPKAEAGGEIDIIKYVPGDDPNPTPTAASILQQCPCRD